MQILVNPGSVLFLAIIIGGISALSAQTEADLDFANRIRTPDGLQKTLERCDGHPDFETALANWLEIVEPSSPADRRAVRETSLRLLEDTTDRQLVLGLSDGLLRHALEDMKRDQTLIPGDVARALYNDIGKAVSRQRSKAMAVRVPAHELGENGTVKDQRQAGFLEAFLKFADPRIGHVAKSSPSRIVDSTSSRREQSDQRQRLPGN